MERFFGFAKQLIQQGIAIEKDSYGEDNLYDLNITDTSDFHFYLSLAKESKGTVLDIGCGTGRVLKALFEAGYEVVGMDFSESMLNVAEKKLTEAGFKPKLFQADMRNFHIEERVSLAIIPNCSMIYIYNDEDRQKVFQSVHQSLETGGLFAFDFDTELISVEETQPWLSTQSIDTSKGEVVISTVQIKGINEQLRVINMVNYRYQSEKVCSVTVNSSFEATCSSSKMTELLEKEGFRVRGIYGDYQFSPYKGEDLCVVVAEKL
jgi:SAM-dependent methyltransferase